MAKTQAADYANFMAYTAYNFGAAVPLGLARTALALYNLAKLYFYQESYNKYEASKQGERDNRETQASKTTRGAKRDYKKAKGAGEKLAAGARVFLAKGKETATRVGNAVEEAGESVSRDIVSEGLDAVRDEWKKQLYRGLAEMIPVIGSAYCTYGDFEGGKRKVSRVDLFGRQELEELVKAQQTLDSEASRFLTG